jgi:hypothetical protein
MSRSTEESIRARLLVRAKSLREEFELTLTRYAVERLLFRMGASPARHRCLLKGASLLAAWLPEPFRATRDVDILVRGAVDEDSLRSLVTEICAVACPEDGLRFDLSNLVIQTVRPEEEYSGKRARFLAWLGKARITVQLDMGVGDAIALPPEEITFPTILPGMPSPRLLAYPREATIAEKFEAMVKLDTRNSRMKDFHDVWALASAFPFEGPALQKSIAACFERRRSALGIESPRALTGAFYQVPELEGRWQKYIEAHTILAPPPIRFDITGSLIITFLDPVWRSIAQHAPFIQAWIPGGPWTSNAIDSH